MLACGVLTYGGVSLFVVAFAVYPFAAALFREADIPKRLIPGAIALGAFTLTMDALPGSPQIQNLIPTRYFGTDAYAAPWPASSAARPSSRAACSGWSAAGPARPRPARGTATGTSTSPRPGLARPRPHVALAACCRSVLVLAANFVLSRTAWSVARLVSAPERAGARLPRGRRRGLGADLGPDRGAAAGDRGRAGGRRRAAGGGGSRRRLSAATSGALLAIFNTASEVGFGNTVKALPGFRAIQGRVFLVSRHVLVSEAVAVNVLAGITGSASGGLSIALDVMGARYLELARAQGVSPELLHRVASMASGGMDTLPHNGAVITLLAITGLTHRQSYARHLRDHRPQDADRLRPGVRGLGAAFDAGGRPRARPPQDHSPLIRAVLFCL